LCLPAGFEFFGINKSRRIIMTQKNTEFRFQVTASNSASAQATITIDGNPLWAGSLDQTRPEVEPGQLTNDMVPFSGAACQIDLPEVQNNKPQKHNKIITISCTSGSIALVGINQQNNPMWEQVPNPNDPESPTYQYIGGNPNFSDFYGIVTQPLWNGVADLIRYNIEYNLYNKTGPGTVVIRAGETCEFTAALWDYCPVIT
jgi:hypothetical protein